VRNILAQADERGDGYAAGDGEDALREAEEVRLAAAIGAAERELTAAAEAGDYERALAHVARLRPDVDLFFDRILVMDKTPRCGARGCRCWTAWRARRTGWWTWRAGGRGLSPRRPAPPETMRIDARRG